MLKIEGKKNSPCKHDKGENKSVILYKYCDGIYNLIFSSNCCYGNKMNELDPRNSYEIIALHQTEAASQWRESARNTKGYVW